MRIFLAVSKCTLALVSIIVATGAAQAQAVETAERTAEITPFVMTTIINPDYGPHSNLGIIAGVDYTRFFFHSRIQPSLEARYTNATGSAIDENAFSGGIRLATRIRNITPYGTLLVGAGNIHFVGVTSGYKQDTATVYSIGAGADISITSSLRVRADFTHQNWNCDPLTLTPVTMSLGLSYRLGFRHSSIER